MAPVNGAPGQPTARKRGVYCADTGCASPEKTRFPGLYGLNTANVGRSSPGVCRALPQGASGKPLQGCPPPPPHTRLRVQLSSTDEHASKSPWHSDGGVSILERPPE